MLASLSLIQALDLWADLERCREGQHPYGGAVGEFYLYRLMPSEPVLERLAGQDRRGSIFEKDINQAYLTANQAFWQLLEMFETRRTTKAYIEAGDRWLTLHEWDPREIAFEHRIHCRILVR